MHLLLASNNLKSVLCRAFLERGVTQRVRVFSLTTERDENGYFIYKEEDLRNLHYSDSDLLIACTAYLQELDGVGISSIRPYPKGSISYRLGGYTPAQTFNEAIRNYIREKK